MSQVVSVAPSAAERPLFAGLDIGGTSVKIGLIDNRGRSLGKTSVLTHEERGPDEAMTRTVQGMNGLLTSLGLTLADVGAIGIGSPGPQDCPSGMIIAPDNLPHWRNFALVEFVKKAAGKPVSF